MTARLLDFAPAAWQAYQGQRASELGGRLKRALRRLAQDPAAVHADPRARRYRIVEERLRQAPPVWGLVVDAPDGTGWLIVWRERAPVIEIGYIGPAPGQAADDPCPQAASPPARTAHNQRPARRAPTTAEISPEAPGKS